MKPTWTDEQAADATIEVLSDTDFEVMVMRSWFKPDPGQTKPGPSEWVARRDHARGMLQVGRALLALRARVAKLERERDEAVRLLREAELTVPGVWPRVTDFLARPDVAALAEKERES